MDEKVTAIVSAFNEEKNIKNVLDILLASKKLDEVILVDDGSKDKTSKIAKNLGAKIVILPENSGKAKAMKKGIESTKADVIVFFDADLIGLNQGHINSLISPILKNEAVMSVEIRDRWWGLPRLIAQISPFMFTIGGERAIRPFVLKDIPQKFIFNLTDVMVMNYYCKINHLPVKFVYLKGLDIVVKEKKWGFLKGFIARFKTVVEFIKVRILIFLHKNEFSLHSHV